MTDLNRRLAALERAVAARELMAPCLGCGFPAKAKLVVVLNEGEELEACEHCGRSLHPKNGAPVADVVKVIRL